jgi:hypothetical protein
MTELKYLLDEAVPARPGEVVDPAADVARGRRHLHRRRLTVLGGAAAVVVAAPLAFTLATAPGDPVVRPVARSTSTAGTRLPAVDLVAYTGKQVPGYRVSEVPAGWEIQGGNAFALALAPKNFPDRNTDSFAGKIVVMLESEDVTAFPDGAPITVDGRPGVWSTETTSPGHGTQLLTFEGKDGRTVVVQVPTTLGWDAAHLARFGAGVEVLGNAAQGRG